ncbi:hypothetical protein KL86PLE_130061 [uncultured Pleomorphomonas sp.]|uniref:Uncharacterized protein n=1 Tax=uncultured Pleomorphomonas sp. TaxID=442121 RepID=A0A212L9N6_9HYPH|nr:hypothetical protein KL86PLE_130061 [uncultured Pleomorphomonas sp.]
MLWFFAEFDGLPKLPRLPVKLII